MILLPKQVGFHYPTFTLRVPRVACTAHSQISCTSLVRTRLQRSLYHLVHCTTARIRTQARGFGGPIVALTR